MSEQTLRPDAICEHLEEVIESAGIAVEIGVVFGSWIRDDAAATSDTDVLLVSLDFAGIPGYRRPAPIIERWDHTRYGAVDVLCYTPAEFRD